MSVFVLCTAVAAAGFAAAFEVGRVCEKRLSGSSKLALPFDGFNWQSDEAKLAAKVFGGLFLAENTFLPRSLNPFSYVLLPTIDASVSAVLAFFVLGSWTGLLVLGYGAVAASLQGLHNERLALEADKVEQQKVRHQAEKDLCAKHEELAEEKRKSLASRAAVAGEWKKLHLAREENNAHMERSENEKIWSNTIRQEFDQKTLHVVDNALDKRWRDVEDQRLNLEQIRKRNEEKQQKIQEQRAQRAEKAKSQKNNLNNEKNNLLKLAKELEDLKDNMQQLKKENTKKEQQKLKELKDRAITLKQKEDELEQSHLKKLEKLKVKEQTLKEKQERFDSGEERRKLQELSEKLESSKLTVAKFNETVMMKERKKAEELRMRELVLRRQEEDFSKRREEEFAKMTEMIAKKFPDLEPYDSAEDMPEDEASQRSRVITVHRELIEAEGQDEEKKPSQSEERDDVKEDPTDEMESTADELSTIREDEKPRDTTETQSGEENGILKTDATVDTDDKSTSIRLLSERDIAPVASETDLSKPQNATASIADDATTINQTIDTEDKSIAISLLAKQDTVTVASEERMHSSSIKDDLPTIREKNDEDKEEEVVDKEELEEAIPDLPQVNDEPEESSYKSLLDDDEAIDDDESIASLTKNIPQNIVDDFAAALRGDYDEAFDAFDNESVASTCLLNVNDDHEATAIEETVGLSNGALANKTNDDDDSTASTNVFNSNGTPRFPVSEEMEKTNADAQQALYYDSDNDSLFHQIQSDVEANERAAALDVECSSTATVGEPVEEDASPVSAPLQERSHDNVTSPSTTEMKNGKITPESLPKSPTSTTNDSVSYKDAQISMIDSKTTAGSGESFKDANSIAAMASDSDYDNFSTATPMSIGIYQNNRKITSVKRKPAEDKVVVSEDGGVELIAWSERSVFSRGNF